MEGSELVSKEPNLIFFVAGLQDGPSHFKIGFVIKALSDSMKIHLEFFIQIKSANGLIGESVNSRWKQACFIFLFSTYAWDYIIKWVKTFIQKNRLQD